ncbi:MAG: hypothetical protein FJ301_10935 [Planctomycetes bacterium]|nr:hypothetical protein [Planctomycetota bacterium]
MRQFALVLTLLPLAACSSMYLDGKDRLYLDSRHAQLGEGENPNQGKVVPVAMLTRNYQKNQFWGELRRRSDGRNNAFARDLMSIQDVIDRTIWNYNQNDPYVNYSNDQTKLGHFGRFGLMQASTFPGVDEIVTR